MSERERSTRTRLRDDFTHYAEKCLRIRTKAGKVEPLVLNSAQRYIHGRLQAQAERVKALEDLRGEVERLRRPFDDVQFGCYRPASSIVRNHGLTAALAAIDEQIAWRGDGPFKGAQ